MTADGRIRTREMRESLSHPGSEHRFHCAAVHDQWNKHHWAHGHQAFGCPSRATFESVASTEQLLEVETRNNSLHLSAQCHRS